MVFGTHPGMPFDFPSEWAFSFNGIHNEHHQDLKCSCESSEVDGLNRDALPSSIVACHWPQRSLDLIR
jgi:hypothetical protein